MFYLTKSIPKNGKTVNLKVNGFSMISKNILIMLNGILPSLISQ